MMIIPRVARIALCMRQFSTASKAASKLTESARKPEARSMATAADSKMEFQRSTYYVGDTPGWTNEWYKENDSPRCLFARACCDPVHCAAHVRCLLTPVGFLFAAPSWTSSRLLLPPTVRALRRHGRAPCVSCALQTRSAETATATGELMRTRLHPCRDQVPVAGLTHRILQRAKQQAVHGAGNPIQASPRELREIPGAIHSEFRLPLHHWGHLHLQLQIRIKN